MQIPEERGRDAEEINEQPGDAHPAAPEVAPPDPAIEQLQNELLNLAPFAEGPEQVQQSPPHPNEAD